MQTEGTVMTLILISVMESQGVEHKTDKTTFLSDFGEQNGA